MLLFVWWMSCTYNGWALPLQINQTWHCPALEHLGRPRDRIKGSPRPWTLSVPNTHSELKNSYPAHFSHHHLYWLCLLVISYFSFICSTHIPLCFRHGNWVQLDRAINSFMSLISNNKILFLVKWKHDWDAEHRVLDWLIFVALFQLTRQTKQSICWTLNCTTLLEPHYNTFHITWDLFGENQPTA